MANLSRYDPFALEPVSELFQGLFRPMRGLSRSGDEVFGDIKVDVSETDHAYIVKADMPGLNKQNIDLRVEGTIVSISAKVERNKELQEGERLIRSERFSGRVERSFSLASEVDEGTVEANYQDGVLKLILPKKSKSLHKKIEIR